METMDYAESKAWLDSLGTRMHGFDLGNIKALCMASGTMPEKLTAIYVAGSNGKGSTCAFIERILREEGYKTGLYTSPHLVEPTERIRINGSKMPEKKFAELATWAREAMERNRIPASHFEALTAMAFRHFLEEKAGIAVIETGLGGRLDATNVLKPLVSVITSISLEHTQYLGETLEKIAAEKAGIIKENSLAVVSEGNAARKAFERAARQKNSKIAYASHDNAALSDKGNKFDLASPLQMSGLRTKMLGAHQCENAALAAAACIAIREKGFAVSERAVRQGLEKAFWPGRLEIVRKMPLVVFDAAHNPDGWEKLFAALWLFRFRNLIMVFGAMADKDVAPLKRHLSTVDSLTLTKTKSPRAEDPLTLKDKLGLGKVVVPVAKAVDAALKKAGGDDLVLITGSLNVLGEAYVALDKKS